MPKETLSGKSVRSTTQKRAMQGDRMMGNLLAEAEQYVAETKGNSALLQIYEVSGNRVAVPTDVGDLSWTIRNIVKSALNENGVIPRDGIDAEASLRNHPLAMATLFRHRLLEGSEWTSDIAEIPDRPESIGGGNAQSILRGLLEVEGGAGESFMYGNGRAVHFNPDARTSVESFLRGILGDTVEDVVASRQPERIVDELLDHSGELRQLVERREIPRPLLAAMVGYVFPELSYHHAD